MQWPLKSNISTSFENDAQLIKMSRKQTAMSVNFEIHVTLLFLTCEHYTNTYLDQIVQATTCMHTALYIASCQQTKAQRTAKRMAVELPTRINKDQSMRLLTQSGSLE